MKERAAQALAWLKTALTVAAIFAAIVAVFSLSADDAPGDDAIVAISGDGSPAPADEVPTGTAAAAAMPR